MEFKFYNINNNILDKLNEYSLKYNDVIRKMLKDKKSIIYDHIVKDTDWDGYGYKLENPKKIKPIEINGKLSFWDYDYKE